MTRSDLQLLQEMASDASPLSSGAVDPSSEVEESTLSNSTNLKLVCVCVHVFMDTCVCACESYLSGQPLCVSVRVCINYQ